GKVVDLDVAVHVGGGKADGAAAHGLAEHPEVLEAKNRMLAGRGTTERSGAPVWQDHGHGPMLGIPQHARAHRIQYPRGKAGPERASGTRIVYCSLAHRTAGSSSLPSRAERHDGCRRG